jgi:hypothetical protein
LQQNVLAAEANLALQSEAVAAAQARMHATREDMAASQMEKVCHATSGVAARAVT